MLSSLAKLFLGISSAPLAINLNTDDKPCVARPIEPDPVEPQELLGHGGKKEDKSSSGLLTVWHRFRWWPAAPVRRERMEITLWTRLFVEASALASLLANNRSTAISRLHRVIASWPG